MCNIQVFELRLKVYLLQNIELKNQQIWLTELIDKFFQTETSWMEFHIANKLKMYSFSGLYTPEKEGMYKAGKIYTVTIRTVNEALANAFKQILPFLYTGFMKSLSCEMKCIPMKIITQLYSITPVIMKHNDGYWRGGLELKDFEKNLRENLIKKYNEQYGLNINQTYEWYTKLDFHNKYPIGTNYKNIRILGDKVKLEISQNETAQKLAYFATGVGLLTMSGRGFGFVNYRWK